MQVKGIEGQIRKQCSDLADLAEVRIRCKGPNVCRRRRVRECSPSTSEELESSRCTQKYQVEIENGQVTSL